MSLSNEQVRELSKQIKNMVLDSKVFKEDKLVSGTLITKIVDILKEQSKEDAVRIVTDRDTQDYTFLHHIFHNMHSSHYPDSISRLISKIAVSQDPKDNKRHYSLDYFLDGDLYCDKENPIILNIINVMLTLCKSVESKRDTTRGGDDLDGMADVRNLIMKYIVDQYQVGKLVALDVKVQRFVLENFHLRSKIYNEDNHFQLEINKIDPSIRCVTLYEKLIEIAHRIPNMVEFKDKFIDDLKKALENEKQKQQTAGPGPGPVDDPIVQKAAEEVALSQ